MGADGEGVSRGIIVEAAAAAAPDDGQRRRERGAAAPVNMVRYTPGRGGRGAGGACAVVKLSEVEASVLSLKEEGAPPPASGRDVGGGGPAGVRAGDDDDDKGAVELAAATSSSKLEEGLYSAPQYKPLCIPFFTLRLSCCLSCLTAVCDNIFFFWGVMSGKVLRREKASFSHLGFSLFCHSSLSFSLTTFSSAIYKSCGRRTKLE